MDTSKQDPTATAEELPYNKIEPNEDYFGKGSYRLELGSSPGEAYIQYKDGNLYIKIPGNIMIEDTGVTRIQAAAVYIN